jgi:glycerophosphoryl diester phosphodiesterase
VIPHNGGDGDYPADTLVALENSMAAGGDVVDIDVSMTADGQLVAFHDTTVDAITGAHGGVATMTFAELEQLDAGWGFTAADGSHPFRGMGVRVPLVRDLIDRFPNAFVSLDLKDLGSDIVGPVCKLLHETGRLAKTFVGSDGDAQIIEMRRRCPDVHTTYDLIDVRVTQAAEAANDATFSPPALVDQPPYRIGNSGTPIVTPASVAFAHAHDLAIMTWVVDDEPTMKRLVDMGVDGIYTRKPALLAEIVKQHRQTNP